MRLSARFDLDPALRNVDSRVDAGTIELRLNRGRETRVAERVGVLDLRARCAAILGDVDDEPRRLSLASDPVDGGLLRCIISGMTKATEAVLANALRLGPDERAELAAELLASLDGPADPDAEAAWAVEIKRRVQAIEDGTIDLEPWQDVRRRIENEFLGG